MATGPRPMEPREWEAYTLHLQRVPVEAIEEQTGLSRPRIAAAVDLGRLQAQEALKTGATNPRPAAPRPPAWIRKAAVPQLPGATIPPSPSWPPRNHAPASPRPTAPPEPEPTPAPAPAPASPTRAKPDLDRLACSPEVRAWAAADGWTVPAVDQRLPGAIVLAYLKAHGGNQ